MAKKGRKPKGSFAGKLSNFSTRIQPETRKALEKEAKANGLSISQLAEHLIVTGLARRQKNEKDKAIKALCFVIEQLAAHVVGVHLTHEGRDAPVFDWRSDPFFYRAFKLALIRVLDELEPPGEIKSPLVGRAEAIDPEDEAAAKDLELSYTTPEARADDAVKSIIYLLTTVSRWSAAEREAQKEYLKSMGASAMFWSDFYGMPEAAKDLEIKPRSGKTVKVTANITAIGWSKADD